MTEITKTALQVAGEMVLPEYAVAALYMAEHPQGRTSAFHHMFNAPMRDSLPDETFSHMDDQRVAFRVAFMLSELFEILEKGLGLVPSMTLNGSNRVVTGSDNGELTDLVLAGMMNNDTKRDVVEVVDGLGDLNVVVNGFALELGAPMLAVDQEILASNFTKLDENGNPIVSDGTDGHPAGKIIKGPNYTPPNIRAVLGLD